MNCYYWTSSFRACTARAAANERTTTSSPCRALTTASREPVVVNAFAGTSLSGQTIVASGHEVYLSSLASIQSPRAPPSPSAPACSDGRVSIAPAILYHNTASAPSRAWSSPAASSTSHYHRPDQVRSSGVPHSTLLRESTRIRIVTSATSHAARGGGGIIPRSAPQKRLHLGENWQALLLELVGNPQGVGLRSRSDSSSHNYRARRSRPPTPREASLLRACVPPSLLQLSSFVNAINDRLIFF